MLANLCQAGNPQILSQLSSAVSIQQLEMTKCIVWEIVGSRSFLTMQAQASDAYANEPGATACNPECRGYTDVQSGLSLPSIYNTQNDVV